MPTTRFLPGDKVRVKPRSAAVLGLATNATHTIAHVDDFGQIALRGGSSYYHPSHFELVERAASTTVRYGADPDMPCYSLKDGEGDWWVYKTEDPAAVGHWYLLEEPHVTREGTDEGVEAIALIYGIDDTPAATGVEVYDDIFERTGLPNPAAEPLAEWERELLAATDPAPLQPGEWVQVWASIYDPRGDADEVEIRFYNLHDTRGVAYTRRDAIVRPAEGQVPPWVKPARCTSLRRGGEALWRCVQDEGHDDEHASSGFFWATADEDGRITEGGAS